MSENNEKMYWAIVNKCIPLVNKSKSIHNEVAKLTLEAKDLLKGFTYSKFAEDVGLSTSTLHRWVVEYQRLYAKLDLPADKPINREVVRAVIRKTNPRTTAKETQEIYTEELGKRDSKEDQEACGYIERLKSISFSVNHKWALGYMNRENLEDMLLIAKEIVTGLDNELNGDPDSITSMTQKTYEIMNEIKQKIA